MRRRCLRSNLLAVASVLGALAMSVACGGGKGDGGSGTDASTHPADGHAEAGGEGGDAASTNTGRPPPSEDAPSDDFGALPPPSTHIEATIGPAGGTLAGASGTSLAGVTLTVPPGALSVATTLSLDSTSAITPPAGAPASSAFVVGPNGVSFSIPARLTLPAFGALPPGQLGIVARVGVAWSGLLAPSYDKSTGIAADLPRTATVIAVALDLSATKPSVTSAAPATAKVGDVIFVSGSGFGVAPVVPAAIDAGAASASQVTFDGTPTSALAWQDDAVSFKAPSASSAAAIAVQTPGGVATAPSTIAVSP